MIALWYIGGSVLWLIASGVTSDKLAKMDDEFDETVVRGVILIMWPPVAAGAVVVGVMRLIVAASRIPGRAIAAIAARKLGQLPQARIVNRKGNP